MNDMKEKRSVSRDEAIDVRELVNVFLRRRNLFVYIAIPIFIGIIIAQLFRPFKPIYKATFDVGVTQENPVEGVLSPGLSETPTTQMGSSILRAVSSLLSISLAEKVADTLGLYAYAKNGNSDVTVEARIKEDFAKPIGPLKLTFKDGMYSIVYIDGTSKDGILDEYVDFGPFELKVTRLSAGVDGRVYEVVVYPRERMALALRNSLTIELLEADKVEQDVSTEEIPFSGEGASKKLLKAKTIFPGMNLIGIVRIDMHWSNPDDALKIAKALSQQMIIQNKSEKSQSFTQSKMFIDSLKADYQERLKDIEERIKLFKEEKSITNLEASTQALINQISTIQSDKDKLEIELKVLVQLRENLAKVGTEGEGVPNFAAVLISSDLLKNLYGELVNTEAELKKNLKRYSIDNPKVSVLRDKLDGLKDQMQEEIPKAISSIRTAIKSLENQIDGQQAYLKSVPEDQINLARLERERETGVKLYIFYTEMLEQTKVQEAGVTSDLTIVNPPMVSNAPVNSRRRLLTLFVSLVVSVMAGGFAVFVAEYIDNTVKDPDILTEKTGLALFGTIPAIVLDAKEDKKHAESPPLAFLKKAYSTIMGTSAALEGSDLGILDLDVSTPEFEAFRKLAMNLEFAHPEKQYRAIYVTSPGPEEGKTFTALNLGIVYARTGKKVLLVDTDFRKKAGHLSDVTRSKQEKGLFDVLRGDAVLDEIILPFNNSGNAKKAERMVGTETDSDSDFWTSISSSIEPRESSIKVLPIGALPANPFIFLESAKMKNMINELKLRYDFVIIDGVPVMLFADAAYLANYTNGVLLTTRYGKTDMKDLTHAKDILLTAKVHIIGLVVNGVPKTRGSYYYQYYHKYYDKYYKS
jgi:uncharacterized protein involved in exopolysaccharide biosynthesis/Mrp family chromosome partitioning ATPase